MTRHGHIHTRFNAHLKGMLSPIHKGYNQILSLGLYNMPTVSNSQAASTCGAQCLPVSKDYTQINVYLHSVYKVCKVSTCMLMLVFAILFCFCRSVLMRSYLAYAGLLRLVYRVRMGHRLCRVLRHANLCNVLSFIPIL